jgi:hypothetical protein
MDLLDTPCPVPYELEGPTVVYNSCGYCGGVPLLLGRAYCGEAAGAGTVVSVSRV